MCVGDVGVGMFMYDCNMKKFIIHDIMLCNIFYLYYVLYIILYLYYLYILSTRVVNCGVALICKQMIRWIWLWVQYMYSA